MSINILLDSRTWFQQNCRDLHGCNYLSKDDLIHALLITFSTDDNGLDPADISLAVKDLFPQFSRFSLDANTDIVEGDSFCSEFGLASELMRRLQPNLTIEIFESCITDETDGDSIDDAENMEDVYVTVAQYSGLDSKESEPSTIKLSKALLINTDDDVQKLNEILSLFSDMSLLPETCIRVLSCSSRFESPSAETIEGALIWLIDGTQPTDLIFFYYSGIYFSL
jgi:hypothetical protein